ncbi:hypothetical protein [Streptomyces qinzhouensis]|uniref:Uncharacterized protein n=1 Tax=Streptomyces qinzhouensis TaxID=2599401 RepID=A0A5B8IM49_9ACTN|nr:hypothetical protein [Streptomyces qinzhouensis]QDY79678.1 hypothetical protein FQU76_27615 [Streptomyces qinzhouensis]
MPPAVSDACRYLCAGAHADDRYRSAVIDELSVHEERFTAPSFGIDAARVLAHACYARRRDLGWALAVVALWVLAVPLAGGYFVILLCPGIVLALLAWADPGAAKASVLARGTLTLIRWLARLVLAYVLLLLVWNGIDGLFRDGAEQHVFGLPTALSLPFLVFDERPPSYALLAVFLYALLVFLVGLRRGQSAQVLTGPLSSGGFRDPEADPAERAASPHTLRRMAEIRYEQHAKLVMYHSDEPFRGAGQAFQPWSLSVELRPRTGVTPEPLDNRTVLERVRPLVEALTVPSPHDSPKSVDAVRDRLRELRTDEVVFLPADGIDSRAAAPYDPEETTEHHEAAVEEGGEARRHFLRIRVGGWYEDVVVTVFVRVHTQGGMLVLEVAPHVLMPVRNAFREAEREAHRYLAGGAFGKVAWAVAHTPASLAWSVRSIYRAAVAAWERGTGGYRWALPEGPAAAVRELGAQGIGSLFQQMDVLRYLKSIQDRISEGVKDALRDAGWQTDEFEQKVITVNGGVYIDSARNSAFGFGENSTAKVANFDRGERHGRDDKD